MSDFFVTVNITKEEPLLITPKPQHSLIFCINSKSLTC
jgi:hypothetical protein